MVRENMNKPNHWFNKPKNVQISPNRRLKRCLGLSSESCEVWKLDTGVDSICHESAVKPALYMQIIGLY